jgi:Transposase DDE domain
MSAAARRRQRSSGTQGLYRITGVLAPSRLTTRSDAPGGGLTCKVRLVVDGKGRPLSWALTGGNVNDTTMMTAVLDDIRVPRKGKGRPRTRPDRVLADKGYPSKANRAWLCARGIAATIPERDDQIAHCKK